MKPHRSPLASPNRGIGLSESVWHLRAALNVAALSCRGKRAGSIAANYNLMLKRRQADFAAAYTTERQRYQARYDSHLTKIYNFFAYPDRQAELCRLAREITIRLMKTPDRDFYVLASDSLATIDSAFTGI